MAVVGNGHVMLNIINYYWRIIATAISFFIFGLGGLLLRILVFPLLNILILDTRLRIIFARNIIRFAFCGFIKFMQILGVLRYKLVGLERLNRNGLLILANHPTLIDTVFLMAFVTQTSCIVKSALWRNPFTYGPVRAAGYVCNADGPALLDDCIATLRSGSNLIIFPEGTRTPQYGKPKFNRGAANIAVRTECKVTPVVIRCEPLMLSKEQKWWQVPAVRPQFTLEVQEDIEVKDFAEKTENKNLLARQLTIYLQNYFIEKTLNHATT